MKLKELNPVPGEKLYSFGMDSRCDHVVVAVTFIGVKDNQPIIQEGRGPQSFDTWDAEYFRTRPEAVKYLPTAIEVFKAEMKARHG